MRLVSVRQPKRRPRPIVIGGYVAPGFETVRTEFERNVMERGEIGAAVAAYVGGEKVVDLWGGYRTPEEDSPWTEDTMVTVFSTTLGLAAMTFAIANMRGWLDYDAAVARYWPEFAQNGKASITVRQLLGHEAGLVFLPEQLTLEKLRDLDDLACLLARQTPEWPAGTRRGYHAVSLGFYMQEIIRRVDPANRSLGRFFDDEIARPLGIDFYIGLPHEIPDARLAKVKPLSPMRAIGAIGKAPPDLVSKVTWPWSLLRKSLACVNLPWNERRSLEVEVPAGNGVGTARAIARAYSAFAQGGGDLGITRETFSLLTAPPTATLLGDEILGVSADYSLGFLRPGFQIAFGSSPRAFGVPGAGGPFAFADPDAQLGYAYVTNEMDFYFVDDPREMALREAIARAVARN